MGKREEEEGNIILPPSAVSAVRKALLAAVNGERAKAFEAAQALYAYMTAPDDPNAAEGAIKRTRLREFNKLLRSKEEHWKITQKAHAVLDKAFEALDGAAYPSGSYSARQPKWNPEIRDLATRVVFPYRSPGEPMKLANPKKKDFAPLPASTNQFEAGSQGSVRINPEDRTLHWNADGKNSVDDSWNSPVGRALSKALDEVKWTRGTGGVFRYWDEHAQESAMSHGGNATRISLHKGPLGEQIFEQENGYNPRTMKFKRGF